MRTLQEMMDKYQNLDEFRDELKKLTHSQKQTLLKEHEGDTEGPYYDAIIESMKKPKGFNER